MRKPCPITRNNRVIDSDKDGRLNARPKPNERTVKQGIDKLKMKRKVYVAIALVILGAAIIFPSKLPKGKPEFTFSVFSIADGVTVGGGDFWLQTWQASDGTIIRESKNGYFSEEDAHRALEGKLKDAVTILERKKPLDDLPNVDERIVANYVDPSSTERTVSIIQLQKKDVYRVDAPSLEHALAFEEYRRRER